MPPPTVWTIGHSNRPLQDFLDLLTANEIETIADVRRFPGSRRHPHFSQVALSASLHQVGIAYEHFPDLGGRRSASSDVTKNSAWRVAAFAAFAEYMLTDEFKTAFTKLTEVARHSRTAIMCSEALPWRCHRRLIADQLLAEGWTVLDIVGPRSVRPHELPDFAIITAGQVTYPATPLFPTDD
jgi:uncharacterized protein (DUF488 family)